MKLLVFRSLWGLTGPSRESIARIADAGFDGVEGIPEDLERDELLKILRDHGLSLIAGVFAETPDEFETSLRRVAEYEPLLAFAHSGRDAMSRDAGCAFFERALAAEERVGLPVAHETHRGRLLYSPWSTRFYLERFPELRINADFSHWVTVCERLPVDQTEALELAISRTIHVHGRVGYEQGPQAPDPEAPEHEAHVRWHEEQWDRIRRAHEEDGREWISFTPEYGPPPYLHTLPFTGAPVADLQAVCARQAKRIRERWSDLTS